MKKIVAFCIFTLAITACLMGSAKKQSKQSGYFSDWPAGCSPAEVGTRVAKNYAARQFEYELGRHKTLVYPEVCTWYGSLEVAKLTGNNELRDQLISRFDRFLTPEGNTRLMWNAHVDARVTGAVPLEIYLLNKDEKYLAEGLKFADGQWEKTTNDSITSDARYWVDDIYMIAAVQVQAYRATGNKKYLDRVALTICSYLDKLQEPNGLVFHSPDSPYFWGRGNGWFAVGMTELLRELPLNHPKRARIMEGYHKMMAELLKDQGKSGLWKQLVDKPESWDETSGSGMFAVAMVTGVKLGWLDAKTYGPAARKAWLALVGMLDADNNMTEVCVGTNMAFKEVGPDLKNQLDFYMKRPRNIGDLHGQAPILWTAAALLRELK